MFISAVDFTFLWKSMGIDFLLEFASSSCLRNCRFWQISNISTGYSSSMALPYFMDAQMEHEKLLF